ncbi:MAG TPA: DUF2599 domain-containing protein [Cellulomonas sp.]|uniref:DUF2599 domain-containing protein n=1 Tax=Cellulomonas sp. TaxID=40001 RepID=UPI002E35E793|nr:DUF2599 domain-containing protein [Cellulomonas sp.]HEX5333273.1 DUF2599 domain-containing protein [Cellulomonas sp.]
MRTTGATAGGSGARRPAPHDARLGALIAVLVSALLTGCTATGDPGPGPGASPGASPATESAAASASAATLTSGALTLTLQADRPTITPQPDGSVQASIPLPADLPADAAQLIAPPGTTFDVQLDGSVVVRDTAGAFAGGLASPTATTDDGTLVRARFEAAGTQGLRAVVSRALVGSTERTSGTATVWLGTTLVTSATWGEREGGRSLAVDPTPWARAGGLAAQDATWAAVVALAPDADTNAMHDQFLCHALGAADKATWNLEPWRPDVGSMATLMARCNPT